MRNGTARKASNGKHFEYICPDPVFDGKWKILSHKKLTEIEIHRRLRIMVACGYRRPENGQVISFKWWEMD